MDEKLQQLEARVTELYEVKKPGRADWADWLWENHVLWVADKASEIAGQKSLDKDLCRAAALLHDIADVEMKRNNETHEVRSLDIARQLMAEVGYDQTIIDRIVDDALAKHSCHDNIRPDSDEGQVLATADALAHLQSGFYLFALWEFGKEGRTLEQIKNWAQSKIDRDFNNKILFDDIKEQARPAYDTLNSIFSA